MKSIKIVIFIFIFLVGYVPTLYSKTDTIINKDYEYWEMTEEQWSKEMENLNSRKINIQSELFKLDKEKDSLIKVKASLDSINKQIEYEIYKLVDADKNEITEFDNRFQTTERKILDESAPINDIKEYWYDWISKSKIRLLSQYRSRFEIMKAKFEKMNK